MIALISMPTLLVFFFSVTFALLRLWQFNSQFLRYEINLDAPKSHLVMKILYIYTMEYNSIIKMNEILSFETKWVNMESIMLGKLSQSQ